MSSIVTVRLDDLENKQLNVLKKSLNMAVGSKVIIHILNDYLLVKNKLKNVTKNLEVSEGRLRKLENAIQDIRNAENKLTLLLNKSEVDNV